MTLRAVEDHYIEQVLAATGNNKTQAARILGIHPDLRQPGDEARRRVVTEFDYDLLARRLHEASCKRAGELLIGVAPV